MSSGWIAFLSINPLTCLLQSGDPALMYFARRDLLDEQVPPVDSLWDLPEPARLIRKQQPDGSWRYSGKDIDPFTGGNYSLLETYRSLRALVEMYAFDRRHPALAAAAEYVFACQTEEGDVRGIIGNQYMPYYHGAILELLIKAGYANDKRALKGLEWLLSMRQEGDGWIVPTQAVPSARRDAAYWQGPPIPPQRALPHSHLATGMVLRAFAAHPEYRLRPETLQAAGCLKARLFKADKYNDRKAPSYWLKFQFPFWWTSLLTALDTFSQIGLPADDPQIAAGIAWFREHQDAGGLWETGFGHGPRAAANRRWVGLAVCRVFQRFFGL